MDGTRRVRVVGQAMKLKRPGAAEQFEVEIIAREGTTVSARIDGVEVIAEVVSFADGSTTIRIGSGAGCPIHNSQNYATMSSPPPTLSAPPSGAKLGAIVVGAGAEPHLELVLVIALQRVADHQDTDFSRAGATGGVNGRSLASDGNCWRTLTLISGSISATTMPGSVPASRRWRRHRLRSRNRSPSPRRRELASRIR